MRTIFCVLATLMLGIAGMQAQSLKAIKLNAPDKTRGASVMKALADRHSEREFANKKLSQQDLSDLIWAAIGINREDGETYRRFRFEQARHRCLCTYGRGRLFV